MIAALFVQTNGVYFGDPEIDPWDEERDARLYAGPYPVVAHPPCSRWCRLAGLVEARWGHKRGDDGGCFAAALASVRKWGGGIGASGLQRCVHGLRFADSKARGMAARNLRRMGLSRRAGALRASRKESDVALCVRRFFAPIARLDRHSRRRKRMPRELGFKPHKQIRQAPASRKEGGLRNAAGLSRDASINRSVLQ